MKQKNLKITQNKINIKLEKYVKNHKFDLSYFKNHQKIIRQEKNFLLN